MRGASVHYVCITYGTYLGYVVSSKIYCLRCLMDFYNKLGLSVCHVDALYPDG